MTERELERRAQRRLAVLRHVEEVSGNVAATCRYYGISRQCYYGWLRRYQADGLDGLKDRSRLRSVLALLHLALGRNIAVEPLGDLILASSGEVTSMTPALRNPTYDRHPISLVKVVS